jgi:hypothetical protein
VKFSFNLAGLSEKIWGLIAVSVGSKNQKNTNPFKNQLPDSYFFGAIFWVAKPVRSVPVYRYLGQAFLFQLNDSRCQKDQQFIFVIGFPLIFKQPAQDAYFA